MNKIYKTVWSAEKGTYVAASELVHTKNGSGNSVVGDLVTDIEKPLKLVRFNQIGTLLLLASLGVASQTAYAASGIFINDGTDAGCTWVIDANQTTIAGNYNQGLGISSSTTVKWGSGATWALPTQSAVGGPPTMTCVATDKDSQTNRVLFYGDANASGSKHLTLGGRLDVNGGVIGVGDRAGNNSIRIGGGTSLTDTAGSKSIVLGYNSKATGDNATTIGNEANAAGNQALALGQKAQAAGNNALALGAEANARGLQGVAIGLQSQVLATNAIAVGNSANVDANSTSSIAIGDHATVKGAYAAVALGAEANARGLHSVAMGLKAQAMTTNAIAVGNSASVDANSTSSIAIGDRSSVKGASDALALGTEANARGWQSMAIGSKSQAMSTNAIAVGNNASVDANSLSSIAIGHFATTRADSAIAIGVGAEASVKNTIAIGSNAGIGMTPGSSGSTGAIFIGSEAGSQTTGRWNTFIGTQNAGLGSTGDSNIGIGKTVFYQSKGSGNSAFGDWAGAASEGDHNVYVGESSGRNGSGDYNAYLGINSGFKSTGNRNAYSGTLAGAYVQGSDNVAMGVSAGSGFYLDSAGTIRNRDGKSASSQVALNNTVAVGNKSWVAADDAVAVGANSEARIKGSIALGTGAVADRSAGAVGYNPAISILPKASPDWKSTAAALSIGNDAGVTRQIIGLAAGTNDTDAVNVAQLKELADVAVQYDTDGAGVKTNKISLLGQNRGDKVRITELAKGKVDEDSWDAINGSQLHGLAKSTAAALGGGADVDSDGKVTAPNYAFASGGQFDNVGSALLDLDGRVVKNTADIVDIQDDITTINGDISNLDKRVTQNTTDITTIQGDITSINGDITNLDNRVSTNTTDISNIQGNITSINGDITNLDNRVSTNTTDINTINKTLNDGAFSVSANGGAGFQVAKGTTLDYRTKDGNVLVNHDDKGGFSFALAKDLNITGGITTGDSITINEGGKTTVIGGDKITINGDTVITENNLNDTIKNAVQYDSDSKDVISLAGSGGTKLTNLRDAGLDVNSSDAVTGKQLFATNENVAKNTSDITNIQGDITNLDNRISTNTTDISNIQGDIISINGDITNLDNRVSTNTTDINTINQTLNDGAFSVSANGGTAFQVAKGTTLDYRTKDGNVLVNHDDKGGFSFALAKDLNITGGITTGDSITINEGGKTTVIGGDKITINGDTVVTENSLNATVKNAVQYDSDSKDVISLAGSGGTKLTNLSDAQLDASSSDAVTGKQLFATNENVAKNTSDITNIQGDITSIQGDITTINGDITNLDNRVSTNTTDINTINQTLSDGAFSVSANGGAGFQVAKGTTLDYRSADTNVIVDHDGKGGFDFALAKDLNITGGITTGDSITINESGKTTVIGGDKITINGDTVITENSLNATVKNAVQYDSDSKDVISLAGASGTKLTNLSDAQLDASSSDAVTGKQLFATNENVAKNTSDITNIKGDITSINGDITNLDNRVSTNTTDISNIQGDITSITGDITNLDNRVSTNTTDINTINQTLSDGAFSVAANGAKVFQVAKGTMLDYRSADTNVIVDHDGKGGFDFALAKDLNITGGITTGDSITINEGGNTTVIGGDKITINGETVITENNLNDTIKNAVQYDSNSKDVISLAGASGTKLTNVSDADLNASSSDAVTGKQLFATNENVTKNTSDISNIQGDITNITNNLDGGVFSVSANGNTPLKVGKNAVLDFASDDGNVVISQINGNFSFDLAADVSISNSLSIGNTAITSKGLSIGSNGPSLTDAGLNAAGTRVSNVGDAMADGDAVNKGQLDAAIKDTIGLSDVAVKYDDAQKDRVTLAGSKGTLLTNLQAGSVNALSRDAINGSQLYAVSASVADAFGGNAVVNANGSISAPQYVFGDGSVFNNIGGALANLDVRTSQNSSNISLIDNRVSHVETKITNIESQIGKLPDNAVAYDDASKGNLTLAGDKAQTTTDAHGNQVVTGGGTVIHNVGNGVAAADAVNKGQLDGALSEAKDYTDQKIDQVTGGLTQDLTNIHNDITTITNNVTDITNGASGMFQVSQGGSLVAPTPTGDNSLAGGSGAVASADNSTALGNNAQAKAKNSVALGEGSVANRENSVSVGSAGHERQITNVTAGVEATDAVNVGQLNSVTSKIGHSINQLGRNINNVDRNSRAGIAGAAALANIPQVMNAGQKSIGMGAANYRGENALSIGMSVASSNGNWVFKGSASFDSQDNHIIGGGMSYMW
ncbi:YadA-like family protein [Vitreoscilla massiliensis]|uniref:YadA-like family protein n=1 Tax=Vitreoscilla massiliensis TaxID=1689272 RepID=A0ABY4DYJ7_9NEIS|nr:YadA-like family protein [Vitreoscilla massiliensis]UOO88191.1 YadA-like family protein [Vitreoscilla massiliensis]